MSGKGFSLPELLGRVRGYGRDDGCFRIQFPWELFIWFGRCPEGSLSYLQQTKAVSVGSGLETRIIISAESDDLENTRPHRLSLWTIMDLGIGQ